MARAKLLEIKPVVDGEGRSVYGIYRRADDELLAVWEKRKLAEADMADLEAAAAAEGP